ncbi:hypothetical protein [Streptomyces sp. NPDC051310]|uniref:hypothetical protein n=1 Tax=Streptomyces sp. NPDC051310 TaxID=3365649 RepID=UPI0037916BE3
MARIRMLVSVAGDGFAWEAGQEVDLPGPQAAMWADGVRAEMVRGETRETPEANRATPERTTRARRRQPSKE